MSLDVYLEATRPTAVYSRNITHNLGEMADKAGIYKHLWRPEELNITKAVDLVDPLNKGLSRLKGDPEYYRKFNPDNGWGNYENLVEFVEEYIIACVENKDASISVSR
ncbi:hypothetical protein LCGC14_1561940 [marine sediment metagenome]|uniref:Uncharacterized protein n=1 Tax=marine sediment metagenome TaxID=412755 RepID=A0A0F9IM82_9ZZZZ